ncbi:hypothetical protein Tco_0568672 [Tanacetum coccineum]
MSSATSTVTYISVYTDSEPGRAFWGADDEEPLPPVDSPTAELPRYVTKSDPKEDPEEYKDDEIEDGPVDYPIDGGDDGDDDDGNSSRDDTNDEDEDDEDEEEEEDEHLAPADSAIVVPVDEPVFLPKGTEPVIPPPSTDITIGARITIWPQASISLPPEAERLARCIAPHGHSSSLLPSSGCPTQIQTLRIASTQALINAVTTTLPSHPLPPLPPSLYIPLPGIRDVGYGIRDTWVDPVEAIPDIAPMTVGEVNTRVTELTELHEHDTQDLYALLKDAQDSRSRISQRVDIDSQRVDLLMEDRMTLHETVWMVEEEAYASREAWAHSIGLSQVTHQELQTYRDHVYTHETHLQAHQTQLQLQSTLIQTQHQVELLVLREQQRRARQPGPEARIPDHQDASRDADSHI